MFLQEVLYQNLFLMSIFTFIQKIENGDVFEVNFGRIAVFGSTELTLPDDSTHPPDSIYTGL